MDTTIYGWMTDSELLKYIESKELTELNNSSFNVVLSLYSRLKDRNEDFLELQMDHEIMRDRVEELENDIEDLNDALTEVQDELEASKL